MKMEITINFPNAEILLTGISHKLDVLLRGEHKLMATIEEVKAVVDQLTADQAANAAAVLAEIARVEAVIAALPTLTGIDPAALDPLVAELKAASAGLQATTGAAAAERP